MTRLDRRDRRRAVKLVNTIGPMLGMPAVLHIAAALKHERDETGFKAINYLFATYALRKAKQGAIVQILGYAPKGEKG